MSRETTTCRAVQHLICRNRARGLRCDRQRRHRSEADYGNSERARQEAAAALAASSTRDVQVGAAIALARAGDSARAEKLADQLAKEFPQSTIVNRIAVPTIRASK